MSKRQRCCNGCGDGNNREQRKQSAQWGSSTHHRSGYKVPHRRRTYPHTRNQTLVFSAFLMFAVTADRTADMVWWCLKLRRGGEKLTVEMGLGHAISQSPPKNKQQLSVLTSRPPPRFYEDVQLMASSTKGRAACPLNGFAVTNTQT